MKHAPAQAVENLDFSGNFVPWPTVSNWKQYRRYVAWCGLLGVMPATFEVWRHEAAKIFPRQEAAVLVPRG